MDTAQIRAARIETLRFAANVAMLRAASTQSPAYALALTEFSSDLLVTARHLERGVGWADIAGKS